MTPVTPAVTTTKPAVPAVNAADERARKDAEAKAAAATKAEAKAKADLERQAKKDAQAQADAEKKIAADAAKRAAKLNGGKPVAPVPVSTPGVDSKFAKSKAQRLAELLEKYRREEITPADYHGQRAKILAEP